MNESRELKLINSEMKCFDEEILKIKANAYTNERTAGDCEKFPKSESGYLFNTNHYWKEIENYPCEDKLCNESLVIEIKRTLSTIPWIQSDILILFFGL